MLHLALHVVDHVPSGLHVVKARILLLLCVDNLTEVLAAHSGPVHLHPDSDHGTVYPPQVSDGTYRVLPHLELGTFLVLRVIAVAVSIIDVQALALEVLLLVDDPASVQDKEAGWFVL